MGHETNTTEKAPLELALNKGAWGKIPGIVLLSHSERYSTIGAQFGRIAELDELQLARRVEGQEP